MAAVPSDRVTSQELEAAQPVLETSSLSPDTHIDPKIVSALLLRLHALVKKLLPVEVSEETLRAPDGLANKSVVLSFARAGGDLADVVPFALLEAKKLFEDDEKDQQLNALRATACEVIARRVTYQLLRSASVSSRRDGTYLCLSKRFSYIDADGDVTLPTSALEAAVDQESVVFLSSPEAQACVEAIWTGRLIQSYASGSHDHVHFVPYKGADNGSFLAHFEPTRLAVPRTLYSLSLFTWMALLVVYSLATRQYTGLDTFEIVLWVMLAGYILEDVVRWWKVRGLEALSIWLVVDVLQDTLAIASFSIRVVSFIYEDPDHTAKYQLLAFRLLACLAPFLWIQLLKAFDCVPFFGNIMNSLIRMLRETGIFLVLLVLVGIGFGQALFSLDAADGNRVENSVGVVFDTLLSGILGGGMAFDATDEAFGKPFGKILLYVYSFLQILLLSNILVALLNQAYQDVVDDSADIFSAYFASKVIGLIRAPDQYVYPAPFNLVEAFFIAPLEYVLPRTTYQRVNHVIQAFLFSGPLFVIALYESRIDSKILRSLNLEMLGAYDDAPQSIAAAIGQGDYTVEDPDSTSAPSSGLNDGGREQPLVISKVPFKNLTASFPDIKGGSEDDADHDATTGEVAKLEDGEGGDETAGRGNGADKPDMQLLRELLQEMKGLRAEVESLKAEASVKKEV